MNKATKVKGHLSALFTMIMWGCAPISTKVLLNTFNPVEVMFYRFVLGYIFLWIVRPKKMQKIDKKTELRFLFAGITGITLNFLFENCGLLYTKAANVSLLVSISPLILAIMASIFLGQALKRNFKYGFVVAILGIALICFSDSSLELHFKGDMFGLSACIVWAIFGLLSEKINNRGLDVILITRRLFFYGIITSFPLYLLYADVKKVTELGRSEYVLNLLFLGIGACAVAYISWNYSIGILGTVMSNFYVYFLPVITIIASWIFLEEKITLSMMIGTVLTIIGLYIAEKNDETNCG